jgi:hypothetical protein
VTAPAGAAAQSRAASIHAMYCQRFRSIACPRPVARIFTRVIGEAMDLFEAILPAASAEFLQRSEGDTQLLCTPRVGRAGLRGSSATAAGPAPRYAIAGDSVE